MMGLFWMLGRFWWNRMDCAFGVQVARAFGRLPVIPFLIEHGFDGFSRIMDTSLFDIQHSTFDILTGDRW